MKITSTLLAILFSLNIFGQIALENTYNHGNKVNFIHTVKFSDIPEKYFFMDSATVRLYNLNHSLFKTIPIPPINNYDDSYVFNISDKLFDSDNNLELAIVYTSNYQLSNDRHHITRIINEDGSIILQVDSATPSYYYITEEAYFANTSSGAKMILSNEGTSLDNAGIQQYGTIATSVYSLPGSYISGLKHESTGEYSSGMLSSPIPNPSNNKTKIVYQLPNGESTASIVIYSMRGDELKRYQVDTNFNELILDNSEIATGSYLYNMVTPSGISSAKKMVVIH